MRHDACLSLDLLRYIRDAAPTVDELLEWLGPAQAGHFHVLRKSRLLIVQGGRVVLSPDHLSSDGSVFFYGHRSFHLDENVEHVYGSTGL
jgi:hypothetical protein